MAVVPLLLAFATAHAAGATGLVDLAGEWRFRAGDDLSWASPALDDSGWDAARVPGLWIERDRPGVGVAWYRARVPVPAGAPLGLAVSSPPFCGFEVFAGGRSIGGRGTPPPAVRLGEPVTVALAVPPGAVDADGTLAVAVRVWLHPDAAGTIHGSAGLDRAPVLGDPRAVGELVAARESRVLLAQVWQFTIFVLFLVIGLYHLQLYRRRRERREYLWFALFIFSMAVATVGVTQWMYAVVADPLAARRLVDVSVHVAAFAAIPFFWLMLGRPLGPVARSYQLANGAAAVLLAVWPGMHLNLLSQPWRIVSFTVALAAVTGLVFWDAWRGNRAARTLAAGLACMLAAEVVQVAKLFGYPDLPYLPPIGFVVVVIAMAFALSDRYSRVFDELDALNRDLERRVGERTAELVDARNRALEASRAKSTFLSNMSHELRTPLNAILGYTQLLTTDESLARDHREDLVAIARSGEHLLTLIDDVLSLSKIEAGMATLTIADFDPRLLLAGVEAMVRPGAERKGLALRFETAPGLPRAVRGDAGRLRQVLVNLAGNAVKFTESGAVVVRTAWDDTGSAEGVATFEVEDSGPGIAATEMGRLFEPFSQTELGARVQGGTGLGLAISRELVELMGGVILVRSDVGRGTTFTVRVPLAAAEAAVREEPRGGATVEELGDAELRILVAEDNEVNRLVTRRMLARLGYPADAVGDGIEALEALERGRYDLVLMDVRMPEMDGLEATRRIRERWRGGEAPRVVAMTADATGEDRERCLGAGMDEFLTKPVRIEELRAVIERSQGTRVAGPSGVDRLDAAQVAQVYEALGDAMEELVGKFDASATRNAAAMREALAAGDASRLRAVAHTLKGSSANLGAARLAALCSRLEKAAGDASTAAALLSEVEAEVPLSVAALSARRNAER